MCTSIMRSVKGAAHLGVSARACRPVAANANGPRPLPSARAPLSLISISAAGSCQAPRAYRSCSSSSRRPDCTTDATKARAPSRAAPPATPPARARGAGAIAALLRSAANRWSSGRLRSAPAVSRRPQMQRSSSAACSLARGPAAPSAAMTALQQCCCGAAPWACCWRSRWGAAAAADAASGPPAGLGQAARSTSAGSNPASSQRELSGR